jgi:hypothetical protein
MMVRGPLERRQLVAPKIECGSRGLPGCKNGNVCVKAPGASCGPETDCGGICVKPENNPKDTMPKAQCGSRGLPNCKTGFRCVRLPGRNCEPETDCGGMCVKDDKSQPPKKIQCGTRGAAGCRDSGFICVKMPGASCGPEADCGGYCHPVRTTSNKVESNIEISGGPSIKSIGAPLLESRSTADAYFTAENRPPVIQCGSKSCPGNQVCSSGICVGARCFLASRNESSIMRCPAQQKCVTRTMKDGTEVTDSPGVCASIESRCLSNSQCSQGFKCQMRPNGDGALCGQQKNCGLCALIG